MASSIDDTKPIAGSPATANVRANFTAAKSEIEALQTDKASLTDLASTTVDAGKGHELVFIEPLATESTVVNAWLPRGRVNRYGTNTIPGSTDMTSAMQAAYDSNIGEVSYNPGETYAVTSKVTGSYDVVVHGNNAVIDGTGVGFTGDEILSFEGGGLTQIAELNANVSKGDTSFTFASSITLVAGDIFIIANPTASSFSGFRTTYTAGEYCEVASVSGNTVQLKNALYDSYVAANVDVYAQSSITPVIYDLTINGADSLNVLNLEYCKYGKINNYKSSHSNNSCIRELNCYATEINQPSYNNVGDGGDDYGWLVVSSQHSRMIGGNGYSRRHAVTMGGGSGTGIVPCRDIKAIGGTFKNDPSAGVHNFDWHGHAEGCEAIDCTIYGGCCWQGKNNGYINCSITSYQGENLCVRGSEILGGKHWLINCRLYAYGDPSASSRGVVDVGGNANVLTTDTTEDVTFIVKGTSLESSALSGSTTLINIRNRGATVKVNVDVDDFTADVNNMTAVVRVDEVTGTADSDYIIIDNIKTALTGKNLATIHSNYLVFPLRLQTYSGSEEITTISGQSSKSATAVTFKFVYPKTPNILMSRTDNVYIGSYIGICYTSDPSTSGFTPGIATDDGSNFGAAETVTINWSAGIREI